MQRRGGVRNKLYMKTSHKLQRMLPTASWFDLVLSPSCKKWISCNSVVGYNSALTFVLKKMKQKKQTMKRVYSKENGREEIVVTSTQKNDDLRRSHISLPQFKKMNLYFCSHFLLLIFYFSYLSHTIVTLGDF